MSIKRYSIDWSSNEYGGDEAFEDDIGTWVRYEDHAEVERRCARLTAAFAQLRFLLDMPPESDENMLLVLARLKNERDRLRKALEFYADKSLYDGGVDNDGDGYFDQWGYEIVDDTGETARKALEVKP